MVGVEYRPIKALSWQSEAGIKVGEGGGGWSTAQWTAQAHTQSHLSASHSTFNWASAQTPHRAPNVCHLPLHCTQVVVHDAQLQRGVMMLQAHNLVVLGGQVRAVAGRVKGGG